MFSCAGRAAFLGAILTVIRFWGILLLLLLRNCPIASDFWNFGECGEKMPYQFWR